MLARRVIALSPDKAFAKQLGTALRAAGGAVEVHTSLDGLGRGEIQAALVVVHADGELADAVAGLASRLTADGKLVAIVPKGDLDRMVQLMGCSDRVCSVLVAEHLRSGDLASTATRVLAGDIFGLEKLVPWGTKIYSQLVGDYQEKSLCIAQVSEFAELMGVRRKYREAVEQVVDEMLMNALYDAPVDDQGKQIFADIPTKTRISLRMEQKVVVQYACDDRTFSVSVRDSYGTLERNTVVRYIDKCLHSEQQIDRKTGGAGLGLYLIANSATRMFFNVLPGVATEAVCSFDLDQPKVQLQKFGFFHERIDAAGRLAAGPSRLLPAGISHPVERRQQRRDAPAARAPGAVIAALSAAIVLLLVLIGLVAYPRLQAPPKGSLTVVTTPGATIEIDGKVRGVASDGTFMIDDLEAGRGYEVRATLDKHFAAETVAQPSRGAPARIQLLLAAETSTVTIESDPTGATVLGLNEGGPPVELGKTPLTSDAFEPGEPLDLVLRKGGYADEKFRLQVPTAGGHTTVSKELDVSPEVASIVVTSDPSGADVFLDGARQAGVVTPTEEILVEAGRRHTVRLELARHVPAVVSITPGRGARGVPVTAKLTPAVTISVKSNLDARVTISGLPLCEKKATPVECIAPPGKLTVKLETTKMSGKIVRELVVGAKDLEIEFELGVVVAPSGGKLLVAGREVERAAFEAGKRITITVADADGVMTKVEVRPLAGKQVVAAAE